MILEFNENEVINLVSDLVKIPSINPPGNEELVTRYLCRLFESEGIKYHTIEVSNGRKNIIAILEGQISGDGIIFTGHQDVVPVSEDEALRWDSHPFSGEITDEYIKGRGSSDMKSGLGAAIMAMITIKRNNIVPKHDIIIVATVDEEHYMNGASMCLDDNIVKTAKYAVVCEPTGMKVCSSSRGRTWAEIIVHGKTAHGSQYGLGVNAIEKCAELIQEIMAYDFSAKTDDVAGRTFWQPYAITAGVEPAIVPDRCSMFVDARLTLGHYPDEVWYSMEEIFLKLKLRDSNFNAEINVIEKRSPWKLDRREYILDILRDSMYKFKVKFEEDLFQGTTDGTKFYSIGIKPIIFGPGDLSCVHKENEKVSIKEVIMATKIYIDMMTEY